MPLFAKEPLRIRHDETLGTDGSFSKQQHGPIVQIFSRLLFEDADEAEWMYVATSRQMQGMKDKIQRKLRIFNAMTSYERRHTRVQIRNGNEMSIQLFRSDSIHDEECIAFYDLRTLQNVKNISIKQDEALPYLSFRDEEDNNGAGVAVTELVFGDIGLRLEFEESVSDGAHHGRHASGFGSGGGGGGINGAGGAGNGAAAELASKIWSPFDRVATAVVNEINADGNTDGSPNRPTKGSAAGLAAAGGKSSKKLQKKLERKGKAVSIHFVFPTVQVREEWGHWFRVLMRHLELQRIAEQEIDPVTAMPIDPVDADFVQRITDVRTSTLSSAPFLKAVKDLTTKFMNLDIPALGSLEPPNKGRLQARVPGYDHVGHYELSAWVQSGEIVLTPYRPKKSIATSLLNFHHAFRDASVHHSHAEDHLSRNNEAVRKIRLNDFTLIRAPSPWSCEFQIVLVNYSASRSGGTSGGGGGDVAWQFIAPSAEERKNFVEWLRLVKGRGTKSQTEAETYPYQFLGRDGGGDGGDGEEEEVGSDELGADFMFLDNNEGQRRRRLLKELHNSSAIGTVTAAAAAAFAHREKQLEIDDDEDTQEAKGAENDPRPRQRRRGKSAVSIVDPEAAAIAAAAAAKEEEAERQRRQHLAILDFEYQAFRELHEPYPSPRSDDTVHSIRRFAYFPGHRDLIVKAYLDEVCAIYVVGRGERAGVVKSGLERGKAKRHWAYAEAARLRTPNGEGASSPPSGRPRRSVSNISSNEGGSGGSFAFFPQHRGVENSANHAASSLDVLSTDAPAERSVLVEQLLVKRRRTPSGKREASPSTASSQRIQRDIVGPPPPPRERSVFAEFDAPSFASPLASKSSSFSSAPGWANVPTAAQSVARKSSLTRDVAGILSPPSSSSNGSHRKQSPAARGRGRLSESGPTTSGVASKATVHRDALSAGTRLTPRPNLKPGAFSASLMSTPKKQSGFSL
jgi:hypothetical protein